MKKLITRLDKIGIDVIVAICDCGGTDHHIVVTRDKTDFDMTGPRVYFDIVQPKQHSIVARVAEAIRYIFNGPTTDSIILHTESAVEFGEALINLTKEK